MFETIEKSCDLYDNVLLGICVTEFGTGVVIDCNEHLAHMLGYESKDELIGQPIVHRKGRDTIMQSIADCNGKLDNFEAEILRKDGSVSFQRILCRLSDDKTRIMSVVIDVSNEKAACCQLEKRKKEVELANAILLAVNKNMSSALHDVPSWDIIDAWLDEFSRLMNVERAFMFEIVSDDNAPCYYKIRKEIARQCKPLWNDASFQRIECYDEEAIYGAWHELLENEQPVYGFTNSFDNDEQSLLAVHNVHSIAVVPIFTTNGSKRYWGTVGFATKEEKEWSSIEIEALFAISNLISLMIGRIKVAENRERVIIQLTEQAQAVYDKARSVNARAASLIEVEQGSV